MRVYLNDPARYHRWRAQKLAQARRFVDAPPVEIRDPARLSGAELTALGERVAAMNFALYRIGQGQGRALSHNALKGLCRQVGFGRPAANPFSETSGISEIRVADNTRRGQYIPYTNRALNWHTDGYYNPPSARINGFVMHTVRPAPEGGENRFLDHEMVYLLLRDRAPALAACLFAGDVMTIPAGTAADDHGKNLARAAQTGAVFSLTGGGSGGGERLQMAFTLRQRHIRWKPSPPVRAALAEIRAMLDHRDNPHIVTRRFAAGEGVISNNVLHNRAAFEDGDEAHPGRLVLRARFYDRINIRQPGRGAGRGA